MPQPPGIRAMSMFFVAVICAFGILGIFSAVGIWRLQNWARLSFLIYSGVMVLMCVLVVAVMWVVLPSLPNFQPQVAARVRVIMAITYGLPAAIGVWWLILFNRKDIARQFQGEPLMMEDGVTPLSPKPACPLPIAVLAGLSLISVCSVPIIFLMPTPVPLVLFGHAISGRPALAIFTLMSLTLAVSGIGLLQLRKWSYPLAIGYYLFWCLNATVAFLNPKTWTLMNDVLAKVQTPGYPGGAITYSRNQYLAASAGGLLFAIAILVTLLYYRTAFYEQSDRKRDLNSGASFPPTTPPPLAS